MRKIFWSVVAGSVVPVLLSVSHAQPGPNLGPPTIDPDGVLTLSLQGESNSNYTFEASADLATWWPVYSTVASNGAALFTYATDSTDDAHYFRARLDVPLPPIALTVGAEAFPRALTLVTAEEGGAMTFTDDGGVIYTLRVPTNAVAGPQVFTMTLVTNLGALPFSAGLLGAVKLEPEGTELLVPAELEMVFPGTDVQNATGFTFASSGSDLHIVPAQGETNRVRFLISQLSGAGASLATLGEIRKTAQTYLAGQNRGTLATSGGSRLLRAASAPPSPLELLATCYPPQAKRARDVQVQIDLAELLLLDYLAEQKQTNGNGGKTSAPYLDFFKANIRPYTDEARGNCALNNVLVRAVRVLGAHAFEFGRLSLSFVTPSLCQGVANCATELKVCCGMNPTDPDAADSDLQLIERNANDLECPISADALQAVTKACHPSWQGQFNYIATTHQLSVTTNSTGTEVFTNFLEFKVEAHLQPLDFKAGTLVDGRHTLEGTLTGTVKGTYHSTTGDKITTCCGNGCYSANDEQSAIGTKFTGKMNMSWSSLPGTCLSCSMGFEPASTLTNIAVINNLSVISRKDGDKCTEQMHAPPPDHGIHSFDFLINVPEFTSALIPLFFGFPTGQGQVTQGGTEQSAHGSISVTNEDPVEGTKDTVNLDWNFAVQN